MFCPSCKSVLKPKENKCSNCGAPINKEIIFSEHIKKKKEVKSAGETIQTLPTIEKTCARCGNKTVFVWTQQMVPGDEPATEFYKCTKCGHTWRNM